MLAARGGIDGSDMALAMIGGIQICVSVGCHSNRELRSGLAASGALGPTAAHYFAAIPYVEFVRESIVSVDVNKHPVGVNCRSAVVGTTGAEGLRPDDRAVVGIEGRNVPVLALNEDEIPHPARGADVRQ